MGNTTFSGPVRSENGFEQLDKNATTGKVDNTYYFIRHGRTSAVGCVQNSDSIVNFTQPANTLITAIEILCTVAPTIGSGGDIGYEVGSTSSGVDIVAAQTDEILDGGTTVVVGNVTRTTLAYPTQDTTTAVVSPMYTASERTVYCNLTTSNVAVTTAGSFVFLIDFKDLPS
jgi:hypothetical protein